MGAITPYRWKTLAIIFTIILVMAGCFGTQPVDAPTETLPVASLPDLTIDADQDFQWQPTVAVEVAPGIATRLKLSVKVEGSISQRVDLALNIMKSAVIVTSCSGSHKVTPDSSELLTTPVKLQPGEYDYDLIVIFKGVERRLKGRFNVAPKN